jgi:TolB-like protein/class 3 adenylate cyclase
MTRFDQNDECFFLVGSQPPWFDGFANGRQTGDFMTGGDVERRLTAILAADVAAYSRLMGADEVGTLKALKAHRKEVVDSAIASHKGRIVKTTGDGMLVEFASVVDAVTCAVVVQGKMAERNEVFEPKISFRIGINIGDIIIDGDDIFGDGVNIAARVENECEPGGVYLSGGAFDQVRGKTSFQFDDLGEKLLKNIDRPVRLYAVNHSGVAAARSSGEIATKSLPLPNKPSIAVLPFQNMSGDPEQEYFADGMVEDIITALSRFGELFVIARNSSFAYKGKAIDIRQVGRELGVRYVLEGSVRKAGNRVRITGQLIDADTGSHLWADRFDGDLQDVFDLQDQVTSRAVNAIAPRIEEVEINRAAHKPTENLDAYDCYLRGLAEYNKFGGKEVNDQALRYFNRAIQIDPNFASASARASDCYRERRMQGWMADVPREIAEATRLARHAAELGKKDATALCFAGLTLAYVAGDVDAGKSLIDRALLLNPNHAVALHFRSWIKGWIGEPDQAIDDGLLAIRLNPFDPALARMKASVAYGHFFAGRYIEASTWAEKSLQEEVNPVALRVFSASMALAGRLEEARGAVGQLLQLNPALRVSEIKRMIPIRRPENLARLEEGLRLAGLPE